MKEPKALWVKKLVSNKEFNEEYADLVCYTYLGKDEDRSNRKIKLGFLVANRVGEDGKYEYSDGFYPADCELLSHEELKILYSSRKQSNYYPLPIINK